MLPPVGDLDVVALQVEVGDLERVAGAGPDDPDHLAARLVLQRVDQALRAGGEVGGRRRQVFLVDDLGLLERVLERLDAVAAERVVLGQRGDRDVVLVERHGVGDRVLRAVAAGAEDVLVPLVAGDRVGDRRLDQQDLLVLLGHRQQRQRDARRRRADGDVGLVVAVGGREQALADVGLALVVLLDHDDLLAGDGHRAAGGVVEAHHEAGLRLLAVGLERPGLAVDVGDADLALRLRERRRRERERCRGDGGKHRAATAAKSKCEWGRHEKAPGRRSHGSRGARSAQSLGDRSPFDGLNEGANAARLNPPASYVNSSRSCTSSSAMSRAPPRSARASANRSQARGGTRSASSRIWASPLPRPRPRRIAPPRPAGPGPRPRGQRFSPSPGVESGTRSISSPPTMILAALELRRSWTSSGRLPVSSTGASCPSAAAFAAAGAGGRPAPGRPRAPRRSAPRGATASARSRGRRGLGAQAQPTSPRAPSILTGWRAQQTCARARWRRRAMASSTIMRCRWGRHRCRIERRSRRKPAPPAEAGASAIGRIDGRANAARIVCLSPAPRSRE